MRVKLTASGGAPATEIWFMKHSPKLMGPAPFSHTEWALERKSGGGVQTAAPPILPDAPGDDAVWVNATLQNMQKSTIANSAALLKSLLISRFSGDRARSQLA